jgi:hypothetical protein
MSSNDNTASIGLNKSILKIDYKLTIRKPRISRPQTALIIPHKPISINKT